ncbi:MAG: thioredoxin domain-containing protein [Anaerolineales bacterium]
MPNQLHHETSPYLLQHAQNPVEWHPWGDTALEKAKKEDKPIFLSIGYSACHWCHVMAHESFEDPYTAELMNRNFINIKVDREERPDLDSIYMDAVVAMTGQGGWPMSVFLTPDGAPFYGGTYFPPVRRYNIPSFPEILQAVAEAWQTQRTELVQNAARLITQLTPNTSAKPAAADINLDLLEQAAQVIAQNYDWKYGGWGQAPKFPQPMTILYLLRRASRGDKLALQIADHALEAMQRGGMYDVIGGGFARYSTDNKWLVPHFEKMLYDNAQLILAYLHAYLITGKSSYRTVCERSLDFVLRELTHSEGGFYSSLDADSEDEEGKFYTWTLPEIREVISTELAANVFIAASGITETGNFEGVNVLQQELSTSSLAEQFTLTDAEVQQILNTAASELFAARATRVRPATDDKILSGWNGLMLRTFAEAGRYLKQPRYIQAAVKNAAFLQSKLYGPAGLQRSWRSGRTNVPAFLDDYACLIYGLTALYQADYDLRWFQFAETLAGEMLDKFADPAGGFFDTSQDQANLIMRPKTIQDNAAPSGNSVAAHVMLELYAFTGNDRYQLVVDRIWQLVASVLTRYPTAFGHWLTAADFAIIPTIQVAILYSDLENAHQFLDIASQTFRPQAVFACSPYPPDRNAPHLLQDKTLLNSRTTAFVCEGFVCELPVNDPQKFTQQLEKSSR